MRQANKRIPETAEKTVRDIRRATRRHHSAEEKIRIVLEGLCGEVSIAELCRKEGAADLLRLRRMPKYGSYLTRVFGSNSVCCIPVLFDICTISLGKQCW
jgi:transposase